MGFGLPHIFARVFMIRLTADGMRDTKINSVQAACASGAVAIS